MSIEQKERLLELLSDRAIFGLTDDELAELAELERKFPDFGDDSFELAAASIAMLDLEAAEPLPAHLRARVEASAEQYFAKLERKDQAPAAAPVEARREQSEPEEFQKTFAFEPKRSLGGWLGWAVAALACVALAVNLYVTRSDQGGEVGGVKPTPTPTAAPPKTLTPAEERAALLASAGDVVRSDWSDYPDPKRPKFGVEGDVVWSNAAQKGFIRFRNLPVNDRAKETYQLWIFDKAQKNPIAAGVFDVSENGEVVVPIDAAIRVQEPTMFGVTAEKPGGVMVSGLEKVLAVAKVSA